MRGVKTLKKTRIFLCALLIVSLFAFAGCTNGSTAKTPNGTVDNGVVKDNTANNTDLGNRGTGVGNDLANMVDDAGDAVRDIVTDGGVTNHNNNVNNTANNTNRL